MLTELIDKPRAYWLAGVFGAALIVHALVAALGGLYNSDYERVYHPVALALAHRQFDQLPTDVALRYPPGFSLFLVFFVWLAPQVGVSPERLVTLAQILIAATTVPVIFVLGEMVLGRRAAILGTGLWLAYPRIPWFTRHPNSEVLFMLLFYVGVLSFVLLLHQRRGYWAILAGVLAGLAMLVRPIALLLGVLFAALVLWQSTTLAWRQRLLWALLILAANTAVITPWQWYLHQRTGGWPLLSVNGARSMYDGITWAVRFGTPATQQALPTDVIALMQRATQHEARFVHSTRAIVAFVLQEAQAQPRTVLKLYALKAVRAWYAGIGIKEDTGLLMLQVPVLALVCWGCYRAARRSHANTFLALAVLGTLYFWGMTIIALSIARYMVPGMGLLFLPTGYALTTITWRKGTKRR